MRKGIDFMNEVKERNELQSFTDENFGTIRTVVVDGNPWFVAKDVCDILQLSNPTMAMEGLEDFERAKFNLGRQGEANIISESGFYTLVLRSRKPIAKPFRLWVTSEVLPSIRRTGTYQTTDTKIESFLSSMGADMKIMYAQINNIENIVGEQLDSYKETKEKLDKVVSNMTLTTVQQRNIHKFVKDRVNCLLGGVHSQNYKDNSRMYFINLWNGLKATFECGSHWQDLNPV